MSDLLDDIRHQFDERLEQLRPYINEAAEIERALEALGGPAPQQPRLGRRQRAVLDHVRLHPGRSTDQIFGAMALPPGTVRRVLAGLATYGLLEPRSDGWCPLRGANA